MICNYQVDLEKIGFQVFADRLSSLALSKVSVSESISSLTILLHGFQQYATFLTVDIHVGMLCAVDHWLWWYQ